MEEDYLELMAQLREAVAGRPGDLRGLQLLARNEAALGNMAAARKAQERISARRWSAIRTSRAHGITLAFT